MSDQQKRIVVVTSLLVVGLGLFFFLKPEESACRQIRAVCEAHGFKRGRSADERRSFNEACFEPLIAGLPVGNIKIDDVMIEACKDRQTRRRTRKAKDAPEEARL